MSNTLAHSLWPLLVSVTIKSLFVLALAGLAIVSLRRASAAARHLVWRLALLGLLLLPLLSLVPSSWQVPVWTHAAPSAPAPAPPAPVQILAPPSNASPSPLPAFHPKGQMVPPPAAPSHPEISWPLWACRLWLLGVLLALLPYAVGLVGIRRLSRSSRRAADGPLAALTASLAADMGCRRPVHLLLGETTTPMTWGWRQTVILLPPDAEEWPDDRRRAVLLHELAHIARGDWPAQMTAHLACACYWFHPGVWLAARQARTESERACDDRVLLAGIPPADYARHLLDVARSLRDTPLPAVLPMAQTSRVEGRLRAVLRKTLRRGSVSRRGALIAGGMLIVMVGTIGLLRSEPDSLEAALTWRGPGMDTPAHTAATIAFLQREIRRFGDADPWAGKAYYNLGDAQLFAGQDEAALNSFNRSLQLPEPPYADSGIHIADWDQGVYALQFAGRYREALQRIQAFERSPDTGPERAMFIGNLRGWKPELKQMMQWSDNLAATHQFFVSIAQQSASQWTQKLGNGVSVQFLGVVVTHGNQHDAYSPVGHYLKQGTFTGFDLGLMPQYPDRQQCLSLILRFVYSQGTVVKTSYDLVPSSELGYTSGICTENGVVVTDESEINRPTDGLRVVNAIVSSALRQTQLRVGVAAGTPMALPPDAPNPAYQWATFTHVILPAPISSASEPKNRKHQ